MELSNITPLLEATGVPVHEGYPPTGARLPYWVTRPLILDPDSLALDGDALGWDFQFTVYACAGSVAACFNLAKDGVAAVQGQRVGSSVLTASVGYNGAPVEGHYESQITIQVHQGGL